MNMKAAAITAVMLLVYPVLKSQELFPAKKGDYWGFIDSAGVLKIEAKYDRVQSFNDIGFATVSLNHRHCVIDKSGNTIVIPQFADFNLLQDSFIVYKDNKKWGINSLGGKKITGPEFDEIIAAGPDAFAVKDKNLWGLISLTGNIFFKISCFEPPYPLGKFFIVKGMNGTGLTDENGKLIFEEKFRDIKILGPGYFNVQDSSGLTAIADLKGNFLSGFKYYQAVLLNAGFAKVYETVEPKLLSLSNGKILDSLLIDYYALGETMALSGNGECYLYGPNGKIFPESFESITIQNGEYLLLKKNNLYGISDTLGNIILKVEYDIISESTGPVYVASKSQKWGAVNKAGTTVIPFKYQQIEMSGLIAKATGDKSVTMYEISSDGKIDSRTEFTNTSIMSVDRLSITAKSADTTAPDPTIWKYSNGKWGLLAFDTGYLIKPMFSNVNKTIKKDFAIVTLEGKISTSNSLSGGLEIFERFGVVNQTTRKYIARPMFQMIDIKSLEDSTCQFFKAMRLDGIIVFIDKATGKVRNYNIIYCDDFTDKYARVYIKGHLSLLIPPDGSKPVMTVDEFKSVYNTRFNDNLNELVRKSIKNYGKQPEVYLSDGQWNYIDKQGKIKNNNIKDTLLRFSYVENYHNSRAITCKAGKYGLISESNEVLIPFEYSDISYLEGNVSGLLKLRNYDPLYTYLDTLGAPVSKRLFNKADNMTGNVTWVEIKRKRYLFTKEGALNEPPVYQRVQPFSEGLSAVKIRSGWGVVNEKFEKISEFKYRKIGKYSEGLATFISKEGSGFLDESGNEIIKGDYRIRDNFCNGFTCIYNGRDKCAFINKKGSFITKFKFREGGQYSSKGLCTVRKNKKFGVINSFGKVVIRPDYRKIILNENGRILALKRSELVIYDSLFNVVKKINGINEVREYKEGLAAFTTFIGTGFIDVNGNVIINPVLQTPSNVNHGHIVSGLRTKRTLINVSGARLNIPAFYNKEGICNGLILTRSLSGYYFMDVNGENIFKKEFKDAAPFVDGYARVKDFYNNWGLIDTLGFYVVPSAYSKINNYNKSGVSLASFTDLYGIADINGNILADAEYLSINILPSGIIRASGIESIAYMKKNGNWIWKPE
ncbi:MAG: WG repeat-containing protein [Bacteroidia bacterium]|nr:WG repeat-containing protein [Bacteroidia bacterium]